MRRVVSGQIGSFQALQGPYLLGKVGWYFGAWVIPHQELKAKVAVPVAFQWGASIIELLVKWLLPQWMIRLTAGEQAWGSSSRNEMKCTLVQFVRQAAGFELEILNKTLLSLTFSCWPHTTTVWLWWLQTHLASLPIIWEQLQVQSSVEPHLQTTSILRPPLYWNYFFSPKCHFNMENKLG